MINRILGLDLKKISESFFLWGPRQTGKTWLLKKCFPHAEYIDLLKSDVFIQFQQKPYLLREIVQEKKPSWVILDEIQKVPLLLDEVHTLLESSSTRFALCGSSTRKVKRGHANLLGGRVFRRVLNGVCTQELGSAFDILKILYHGYLPKIYLSSNPKEYLRSYVADYLKEEVLAEGLVRNLPTFSSFLEKAALSDTEIINYASFAREVGISQPAIKTYFEILIDTLLARFLPSFTKRPKRRTFQKDKFYFFDVGIVGYLARRGRVQFGSEVFGKAFENLVFHELCCYQNYQNPDLPIYYWRLPSGIEVDFILGDMCIAIEAKASTNIHAAHLKGLREIIKDHPCIKQRILVSLENNPRRTEDGIEILPYLQFVEKLWNMDF